MKCRNAGKLFHLVGGAAREECEGAWGKRGPSSNLLTCYVGGHWRQGEWGEMGRGERGWLRVNIMHAWLPPDTQHEQLDQWADPTDSALFEWINAPPRPSPLPLWMWIWILDSRFWIWISVVFGLRLTVYGFLSALDFDHGKFIVCHVCGCLLCRFVSSVLATNNFDCNCIANRIN